MRSQACHLPLWWQVVVKCELAVWQTVMVLWQCEVPFCFKISNCASLLQYNEDFSSFRLVCSSAFFVLWWFHFSKHIYDVAKIHHGKTWVQVSKPLHCRVALCHPLRIKPSNFLDVLENLLSTLCSCGALNCCPMHAGFSSPLKLWNPAVCLQIPPPSSSAVGPTRAFTPMTLPLVLSGPHPYFTQPTNVPAKWNKPAFNRRREGAWEERQQRRSNAQPGFYWGLSALAAGSKQKGLLPLHASPIFHWGNTLA